MGELFSYLPIKIHQIEINTVPAFVSELDYVAEPDGKLVGNVMYSKAKVIDNGGSELIL